MQYPTHYDVIVIGGGHAGTEAALAAARTVATTLLLTQNVETIGQMSCNPAIGGIGKSHLVREIDALDGAMGRAADAGGIQFRTLNASKGPAVRATRAQADRVLYKQAVRRIVENQPNLDLFQQSVVDLLVSGDRVNGVRTQMGLDFLGRTVVLTTGTFLGGKIHIGEANHAGGRAGDAPSIALAERLRALPFRVGRLKTGTPPRIDGRSVDFSVMQEQPGDEPRPVMSFLSTLADHPKQVSCYITHTNERTHEIIAAAFDRSPLFSGTIEGTGPRYCPSIEDKVVRFADKASHQVFVEPEGLDTHELYPNGISTSLPFDVQIEYVRSIRGFENAHITRPGYAIEYDFFDPRDLNYSLETRAMRGLYFAGQINGTTGYEEAAAQGLVAGLNASRAVAGLEPWCPGRDEAYIGVLIDDLINLGTNEPYRMFTSRAEYRLRLREDNADQRLTAIGRDLNLVGDARWTVFRQKEKGLAQLKASLVRQVVSPNSELAAALQAASGQQVSKESTVAAFLKRPEVNARDLTGALDSALGEPVDAQLLVQAAVELKYEGYIARQSEEIARIRKHEKIRLPQDINYDEVEGLSNELREKLAHHRSDTLARAARIPGMTPAALSLLLVQSRRVSSRAGSGG